MDQSNPKKLYRSRKDRVVAGVCGGLGEYFNMDSLVFRVIFLMLLFAGGGGLILYIILAIIIPNNPLVIDAHVHSASGGPQEEFSRNVNQFASEIRQSAQRWAGDMRSWEQQHH